MESIQGAVLAVKLAHLDRWNEIRRSHAALYDKLLAGSGYTTPAEMSYARHIYHLSMIQTEDRDRVRKALAEQGIETGVHYPDPVHLEEGFRELGHRVRDFPIAEHLAKHCISLPNYPELSTGAVELVASRIRDIRAPAQMSC